MYDSFLVSKHGELVIIFSTHQIIAVIYLPEQKGKKHRFVKWRQVQVIYQNCTLLVGMPAPKKAEPAAASREEPVAGKEEAAAE